MTRDIGPLQLRAMRLGYEIPSYVHGPRGVIRRDPISVIVSIGAAISSIGAGVGGALGIGAAGSIGAGVGAAAGVGISLGGIGASLAGVALSVGLSYAANAIMAASMKDRGGLAQGINAPEVRLSTRQEIPPRRRVYGEALVGGALFFEECKPPFFYRGFLISDGPVEGPVEFYNSQALVGIDLSTLEILSAPYVGRLRISFRNGTDDQAVDPILLEAYPNIGAEYRQRGVATLVVEADYGDDFEEFQLMWGSLQRPNPLLKLRGVPVYDPRDPMQRLPIDPRDPEDMADARSTWKWSRTASLIQADYLWWEHGGRVPLHKLRWDEIAESAEWDDGVIQTKAGRLIPRHTIDGVVTAGQVPLQILTTMLSANRGFISRKNGKLSVISSQPKDPIFTITDDMVVAGMELRRSAPKGDRLNKIRARFIDPRQEWQAVDGPVIQRDDYLAIDGDLYEGSAEFAWTSEHERAQRLQNALLEDTRRGRLHSLSLDMRAFGLEAGDVVRRFSEVLPRCNGIYRVQEVGFSYQEKTIDVSLAEYDKTVDTLWDAQTHEQDFELEPLDLSQPEVEV